MGRASPARATQHCLFGGARWAGEMRRDGPDDSPKVRLLLGARHTTYLCTVYYRPLLPTLVYAYCLLFISIVCPTHCHADALHSPFFRLPEIDPAHLIEPPPLLAAIITTRRVAFFSSSSSFNRVCLYIF